MPVTARPPHRRLGRKPSSDAIEEDDEDERHDQEEDVVEDEEDEEDASRINDDEAVTAQEIFPGRRSGRSSRRTRQDNSAPSASAVTRNGRRVASPQDDDDSNVIDVSNFSNQPLNKTDHQKLGGLVNDWEAVIKNIEKSGLELIENVAESMAEAGMGDDKDEVRDKTEGTECFPVLMSRLVFAGQR